MSTQFQFTLSTTTVTQQLENIPGLHQNPVIFSETIQFETEFGREDSFNGGSNRRSEGMRHATTHASIHHTLRRRFSPRGTRPRSIHHSQQLHHDHNRRQREISSGYDASQNVRDMELDDNVSVELLDLGEQIGAVETGLSEHTISHLLKTRTTCDSDKLKKQGQGPEICVVCQDEYKNQELIGRLDCGHEYHASCIKSWLLRKNVCPICKRKGLDV